MYLVLRKGIYIWGVLGLFSSPELAKQAAIKSIEAEPDHYHGAEVFQVFPDTPVDQEPVAKFAWDRHAGIVVDMPENWIPQHYPN